MRYSLHLLFYGILLLNTNTDWFRILKKGVSGLCILLRDLSSRSICVCYVSPLFIETLLIQTQPVYIYRVVLDSVNGVSSTRSTSIAALDLQEGEIRQLQFVEDDTLMILWSHPSMSSLSFFSLLQQCLLTLHQKAHPTSSTFPSSPPQPSAPAQTPNPHPIYSWNTRTAAQATTVVVVTVARPRFSPWISCPHRMHRMRRW